MQDFPEIKKKLGFGMMRLPMNLAFVDVEQVKKMVDRFITEGFNYFDTAHGYIVGQSETAVRKALASRYPRDAFVLTNKLTASYFKKEEEIRPLFQKQLDACGVEYFDFYLMHAQNAKTFERFKAARAYETAFELKKEGKVKHVGISFHDKPEVLDQILTEYPEIEVVQIQLNYLDYEDAGVESRKVYEVCEKHDKGVFVMEPVKGGSLVRLPEEAAKILDELHGGSYASYAIRFAAGFKNIVSVLSGMSSLEQMEDNISYMKEFVPLNEKEQEALKGVVEVFKKVNVIPCTSCRYCIEENKCPANILIPDVFACYNAKKMFKDWNASMYYSSVVAVNGGKASACLKCGKCENVCPQHLPIRQHLKDAAREFERKLF